MKDKAPQKRLFTALVSKHDLKAAIDDCGAMRWSVRQIGAAIADIGQDPKQTGVVASCQEIIPSVCERLAKFIEGLVSMPPGTVPDIWALQDNHNFVDLDLPIPLEVTQHQAKKGAPIVAPTVKLFRSGVFDVLGWVLSSFGPVSSTAKGQGFAEARTIATARETFLLPMLALYGSWCHTLGTRGGTFKGKKKYPSVVEIAVRLVSPTHLYFALGASVAGMDISGKASMSDERKKMMESANLLTLQAKDTMSQQTGKSFSAEVLKWSPNQILKLLQGEPAVTDPQTKRKCDVWDPKKTVQGTEEAKRVAKMEWERANAEFVNGARKVLKNDKSYGNVLQLKARVAEKEEAIKEALATSDALAQLVKPLAKNNQHVFKGWRDLYEFADMWLNPELLANLDLVPRNATKFGNCAETYPLLILGHKDYARGTSIKAPANLDPFGGMALQLNEAAGTVKDLALIEMSSCLNSRLILRSMGASGKSFFTEDKTPITIDWNCLKSKVCPQDLPFMSGGQGLGFRGQTKSRM